MPKQELLIEVGPKGCSQQAPQVLSPPVSISFLLLWCGGLLLVSYTPIHTRHTFIKMEKFASSNRSSLSQVLLTQNSTVSTLKKLGGGTEILQIFAMKQTKGPRDNQMRKRLRTSWTCGSDPGRMQARSLILSTFHCTLKLMSGSALPLAPNVTANYSLPALPLPVIAPPNITFNLQS